MLLGRDLDLSNTSVVSTIILLSIRSLVWLGDSEIGGPVASGASEIEGGAIYLPLLMGSLVLKDHLYHQLWFLGSPYSITLKIRSFILQ